MRLQIGVRSRILVSSLCIALSSIAACTPDEEPPMEPDAGPVDPGSPVGRFRGFSQQDLETIRTRLGRLPDAPSLDPTNAVDGSDAAAELGRKLFFDKAYSSDGQVSCATCHNPDQGFQDARGNMTSQGANGLTHRHAPTVINVAYGDAEPTGEGVAQLWDGRMDSLWAQALAPPEDPTEMGSSRGTVVALIIATYRSEYEQVFGPLPAELFDGAGEPLNIRGAMPGTGAWDALSPEIRESINRVFSNFGKAIAAYESRVTCGPSRFDAFWDEINAGAEDSDILTDEEKLGVQLFIRETGQFGTGYGECIRCHNGPNFTDWKFHNLGIDQTSLGEPLPAVDEGRAVGLAISASNEFHCASPWSDHPDKESCRILMPEMQSEETIGQFKTPSLRCVTTTAPYMHTGHITNLEEVIDHYARGGDRAGFAGDNELDGLSLTSAERAALIAFLKVLESPISDWAKNRP